MTQIPITYIALLCVIPYAAFSASLQETLQEDLGISSQIDVESDLAAIHSIWHSFKAAVQAGDKAAAVQYFNPYKRDGIAEKFELMGSEFSERPKSWSEFTPVSVGADVAVFTFTQTEDRGELTYSVYFVRHPDLGSLLSQL